MQIPITSPDIRSVYLMDRSGQRGPKSVKQERNPRIQRIQAKVIDFWRAKAVIKS